jgi:hypothetical protein
MNTNRQTSLIVRHFMRLTRNAASAWLLAAGAIGIAGAQAADPVSFEITPAIAAPGVPRQIAITVQVPASCLPTARLVASIDTARKRTLTISLDSAQQSLGNPAAIFCDDLVTRRFTVNYTPDTEGDMRVMAVNSLAYYLGETTLRTRATNSNRSQYDLTGMWYDPATNGSGLTFVHGATRDDQVFGTWYVYDSAGIPRWYTIQNVQWKAGGLEVQGQLYETRANSIVCVPPYTGCPVALAFANTSGVVSIVMQGPNSARITAVSSNGGTTLTSNLIRSIF